MAWARIRRVHAIGVLSPRPADSPGAAILTSVTEQPSLICSLCDTTVAVPQPNWMLEHDPQRGSRWLCVACAREHLRAIESRLSPEWW